jgi:23S rRNA (uracil1939-C5)-methyltransferase
VRPDVFEITGIGSQGDGIAQTPAGPVFVPFALPGERARVAGDGTTELLSPPTLQRETPLCRHFGSCGGCVAQHMAAQIYAEWKRGIVTEAFRRRGLTPTVSEMMRLPARSRRRATFTARQEGGVLQLGYHQRRSRRLIAIEE